MTARGYGVAVEATVDFACVMSVEPQPVTLVQNIMVVVLVVVTRLSIFLENSVYGISGAGVASDPGRPLFAARVYDTVVVHTFTVTNEHESSSSGSGENVGVKSWPTLATV